MSGTRIVSGLATLAGVAVVAAAPALGATSTPAPKTLSNPTRTCAQLTARFQQYLAPGKEAQLAGFVSPAFVIERNDGTSDAWPTYLKNHPTFTAWNISVTQAKFASPAITCVAVTSTTQLVDGVPTVSIPTRNLSTYVWQLGRWRITSYGRFNAVD